MQCGGAGNRGRSRGVEQSSVHQGAVVAVLDQVVYFTGDVALLGLVGDLDLDRVLGVVEVDDVDVEDEHSRARDDVPCEGEPL